MGSLLLVESGGENALFLELFNDVVMAGLDWCTGCAHEAAHLSPHAAAMVHERATALLAGEREVLLPPDRFPFHGESSGKCKI